MFERTHFFSSTKRRKIGGLKNYQRGGKLKKGEVNLAREGFQPPRTRCISFTFILLLTWKNSEQPDSHLSHSLLQ